MVDVELRHLAPMGAIVEEGTFGRAGGRVARLHTTTVSQQIAAFGEVRRRPGVRAAGRSQACTDHAARRRGPRTGARPAGEGRGAGQCRRAVQGRRWPDRHRHVELGAGAGGLVERQAREEPSVAGIDNAASETVIAIATRAITDCTSSSCRSFGSKLGCPHEPRQERTADAAITSTNRSDTAASSLPRQTRVCRRCRPRHATPAPAPLPAYPRPAPRPARGRARDAAPTSR
jgi:hypothetical protein